jgi:hypothetical protein
MFIFLFVLTWLVCDHDAKGARKLSDDIFYVALVWNISWAKLFENNGHQVLRYFIYFKFDGNPISLLIVAWIIYNKNSNSPKTI